MAQIVKERKTNAGMFAQPTAQRVCDDFANEYKIVIQNGTQERKNQFLNRIHQHLTEFSGSLKEGAELYLEGNTNIHEMYELHFGEAAYVPGATTSDDESEEQPGAALR